MAPTVWATLVVASALALCARCQTVIDSIDPAYGSLAGGTRLSIRGSGFGDMMSETAYVLVGRYPCGVVSHQSSSEIITCVTSPGEASTYLVTVVVGSNPPATIYGFTYSDSLTPTLRAVSPSAGPPGTLTHLVGKLTWYLHYQDCKPADWGEVSCVSAITFGGWLCRQDVDNPDTVLQFSPFADWNRYYNGWSGLYRVGCTVPEPRVGELQPALGTAGSFNATIHFEGSLNGGQPLPDTLSYQYDVAGNPYQFQLYPEVDSVSPAAGSAAGGTVLTITGRGFPDLSMRPGDSVAVSMGGAPCAVLTSEYGKVTCMTGARPEGGAAANQDAVPLKGLYPAGRGVEYEFYNLTDSSPFMNNWSDTFRNLWRINNTFKVTDVGNGSYAEILTGGWDSPNYAEKWHCSAMKAFFTAPLPGDYRFYMEADDFGQLNATWVENGVEVSRTIVNLTTWAPADDFFKYDTQASAPITLAEGQNVLLQSSHCNTNSVGHQQVAVRVPVPEPRLNSLAEQQVITITNQYTPRRLYIKYLYGAGAETMAFTISVLSMVESSLDNPSLGLRLIFNDAVVVLPLTAAAADMTAMVEAAFGGQYSLGSNRAEFGIRKQRTLGSLTLEIGIDAQLVEQTGFEDLMAQLVTIPPRTGTFVPSDANCTYYNEYNRPAPGAAVASPPPVADATAGLLLVIAPSQPVAAVIPSGNILLKLPTTEVPLTLPYDADEVLMAAALRNLTNYDATVAVNSTAREGVFFARIWNITFPSWAINSVPTIIAQPDTDTIPDGVMVYTETRPASDPLSGAFLLAFGGYCEYVSIDVASNSEQMAAALSLLPTVAKPLRVAVEGGITSSLKFTITFDPFKNRGDLPPLRVLDFSGVDGVNPNVTVTTLRDGSMDAFYAPIPTEFLRLATATPNTIKASANGAPFACADPTGACPFAFSDALTPNITAVSPAALVFSVASELPLTITGTGFTLASSAFANVTVGDTPCAVQSLSDTRIVCRVSDSTPAGLRPVKVNVQAVGFAAGAFSVAVETLFVTGVSPSPAVVSASGQSVLRFTGKGFDPASCGSNTILIGTVAAVSVACNATALTVLYPGNGGTQRLGASVVARVYESGRLVDEDAPSSPVVDVSASGPAITAVAPAKLPGSGGVLTLSLANAAPGTVTAVYLLPRLADLANYTAVSAAFKARVPCVGAAASGASAVTCAAGPLPNGQYQVLAELSSGLQLLSSGTVTYELFIMSVSPSGGSIGGNTTVVISGTGFSPVPENNLVYIPVPVSSVFLNGIIQCNTVSATATSITCVTQPHLAAEADAGDPYASQVLPVATQPREVRVVICDTAFFNSSILRDYCSVQPETPVARCADAGPTPCAFGYMTDLTPAIGGVVPNRGYGGQTVTIIGAHLSNIAAALLTQAGEVKGECANLSYASGSLTCTVPYLPAGAYNFLLKKANGELSVDALSSGVFTYYTTITAIANNAGSLAGGMPLTLTAAGAGFGVAANVNASGNVVSIAGLPCLLLSANVSTLTCRTPGLNGYVLAEYWNLPTSTYSMPSNLISWTNPVLTRLEKGINNAWGANSPQNGLISGDWFAARYTFYMQVAAVQYVTLTLTSDDDSQLFIDDVAVGNRFQPMDVVLTPGIRKFQITYTEYVGAALVNLKVNGSLPEWSKVTPVPPGSALAVDVVINGVPAVPLCPAANISLILPNWTASSEPTWQVTEPNVCSFIYSSYRTPTLIPFGNAVNGLNPFQPIKLNDTMAIYGIFPWDQSRPMQGQFSVTIIDQDCPISSYFYNTTNNMTVLTCIVPFIPVGQWSVQIYVENAGFTRPILGIAPALSDLPLITVDLNITAINGANFSAVVSKNPNCHMSLYGGGTAVMTGYGFVKGISDPVLNRTMYVIYDSGLCATNRDSPFCNTTVAVANAYAQYSPYVVSCDGPTTIFKFPRYIGNADPNIVLANARGSIKIKPRIYLSAPTPRFSTGYADPNSAFIFDVCFSRTARLAALTTNTTPPITNSAPLQFTWSIANATGSLGMQVPRGGPVGGPSFAVVEFEVFNGIVLPCANATIVANGNGTWNYTESLRCTLPPYMPAATYAIWLCIQPVGCGPYQGFTVPLSVTGLSVNRGSSAGGMTVVIQGSGFDLNMTNVVVRFGNFSCDVQSVTPTSLTCITGALPATPAAPVTYPLLVQTTLGVNLTTLSQFTFTYDPALESSAMLATPGRGSTEGNTTIVVTGSGFDLAADTTITIGGTQCGNLTVVNSTAIRCTTGRPPKTILRVPLPVVVWQSGRGYSRSNATFQYIDVWSRNSTWGGGPLPGEGDSVHIPPGITVLMDVSPPPLYLIVLEGNLVFDDTPEYLNLQAHYILVKGGEFTIGTADKPYAGRANITMLGAPSSRDMPMYGGKAIGVREGLVSWYGQPKTPHYTSLNQSAARGSNTIVLNGDVNWKAGDVIVIASSSFNGTESDEAVIVAIDKVSVPNCTVLTLSSSLLYDHIGAIHTQPGAAPLDMRAEVAVLTRNILFTGDWDSRKYMYGATIMVNTPSYLPRALLRFDNVEVTQSGQAFRLGRYSIHWHLHGDINYQGWVRGCAIHHTYNRAITVHGTHRSIIQNVVAYRTMGHTFFFEDGNEWGNLVEGNIGIDVRPSDALLNTDITPAVFWITNPNNTVRNNVAAGSAAYGFWYRLLDHPEGPSFNTTICPKFQPILEFSNNTAHGNMFYGLRIHPEYYPRNDPCNGFSQYYPFEQTPAVFNGLVAYKNGIKGAVGTQCGLVQWTNMVLGDNGGGPRQHSVSGKDHGGDAEISWVTDDRNRFALLPEQMAGLTNVTVYARTSTGNFGTAGAWPSDRRIAGVITQSPVRGDAKHSSLLALTNCTFVDFSETAPAAGAGFSALEACGKCKDFQGGATTFTRGLTFITTDGSPTKLSTWSWGHQGVYQDLDGTLLNAATIPASLLPAGWALGPGATWHSAVDSELFDPAECVYLRSAANAAAAPITNDGAICSSALTFRRIMLNNHGPDALKFKDLRVTSLATNRTSVVHFTKYNEDGYQFTVPTGRDYWVHWDTPDRVDPEEFTLHKMDLMTPDHYVIVSSKYVQLKDHFTVNSKRTNMTSFLPASNATEHGSFYYDMTLNPNTWWWGNNTYNDTCFKVVSAGSNDYALNVDSFVCPETGCTNLPPDVVDVRNDTLLWSNPATWTVSSVGHPGKPVKGDNVTIPYGWELVIDENPPELEVLVIQGNVRFSTDVDVTLLAKYVIVMGRGALRAGAAGSPHPRRVTIALSGSRVSPDYGVDDSLNLGSKVLAALRGGTIDLNGATVTQRWTRLNVTANAGDSALTLVGDVRQAGWQAGSRILVASTSYNWKQSEMRTVTAITSDGSYSTLTLDSALAHAHDARFKSYPGGPAGGVDMRAEVAMLSSSILITAADATASYALGSEGFGARVVVSGNSTGRLDGVTMEYCGQGLLPDRACVFFDRLASVTVAVASANGTDAAAQTVTVRNPSVLRRSALVWGMNSNVRIGGAAGVNDGAAVVENVMYESLDVSGVDVSTSGNVIRGNLVLGTIKDMTGKSGFDDVMPASFDIKSASNWVEDNVAAGSERFGFAYYGLPCSSSFATGSFRNNTAHSGLDGLWLQASNESTPTGCTALRSFTAWMNWDFGIISMRGIPTDVLFEDVNVLDTKHVGVQVLRLGGFTEEATAQWKRGLIVGQSDASVCNACPALGSPGCHPKLSSQSYNKAMPFTPAIGLQSAQFAVAFTPGPELKAYDKPKGYSMVHGVFNVSGLTLADFLGPVGCGGVGSYALANHPDAPEAFYPHIFSRTNVVNVASGAKQGMFHHSPPNPEWRSDTGCGEVDLPLDDGTHLELTCGGPAHVLWRDLDGTLLGSGNAGEAGAMAGVFVSERRFPIDQGSAVIPGPCTYSETQDSYRCYEGSSSFLLDPSLTPKPVPKKGIWGDPQHFVLESRDADSEDRNFGPVLFNVSGSVDAVSASMDHGCCFAYKCQKRLSTFWTYLPTGQTAYVTFQGTPAQIFRMWLPYADPDAEIILVLNYMYTLNRRFVFLDEPLGDGTVGRIAPLAAPPRINDSTPHGSFYWDQENGLLHVKVKGGRHLEVRTESAIYVSQSFAVTVDQFYSMSQVFLKNLAFAMGIDMARIYTAKIVPGTAVLTTGMGPSWSSVVSIPEVVFRAGQDVGDVIDPTLYTPAAPAAQPDPTVVAELVAGALAYSKAVTSPSASQMLGIEPLGAPTFDLAGLTDTAPALAEAIKTALEAQGFQVVDSVTNEPPPASPSESPSASPTASPSPTPSSVPGASPSPGTANPNSGATDTSGSTDGPQLGAVGEGSSTNSAADASSNSSSSGGSSTPMVAIIVGVVVGCVAAALLVLAAVVVKRRRDTKRKREAEEAAGVSVESQQGVGLNPIAVEGTATPVPLSPSRADTDVGMRRGISHTSHASSVREAFAATNPAYELPSERQARISGRFEVDEDLPPTRVQSGTRSPRVVPILDDSGTTPRGSITGSTPPRLDLGLGLGPRSGAGDSPQQPRESAYALLASRPLVTGHKLPHSAMPLAGASAPLATLRASAAGAGPATSPDGRPKSPAELKRGESFGRASAPGSSPSHEAPAAGCGPAGPHPLNAVPSMGRDDSWWDPDAVQRSAVSLTSPSMTAAAAASAAGGGHSPGHAHGHGHLAGTPSRGRSPLAPLPEPSELNRHGRLPPVVVAAQALALEEADLEVEDVEEVLPEAPVHTPRGDPNAVTRALVPQESFVPRSRGASRAEYVQADHSVPDRPMTAAEHRLARPRTAAARGREREQEIEEGREEEEVVVAEEAEEGEQEDGEVRALPSPPLGARSRPATAAPPTDWVHDAHPLQFSASPALPPVQTAVEALDREDLEDEGRSAARSPAGLHSDSMRRREK
ncbi:hypothetical protein HYH03_009686 [Edaphochlamys debaryana]|uniref:Fibrocystin-L n=1 Tax=Edaphochlamys debaryana TaxID=47281 RepID=A0A835XY59_9CHLO|nr:hypothetical protein HYH03_009686 [Edaphochlamys debaryana]|eukprot:KAG2491954.1 hypothetical protein HYH03_009686 [Edaphochlamys debaryana]